MAVDAPFVVDSHGLNGPIAKFPEHDGMDPHAEWIAQHLLGKSFADRLVRCHVHGCQAAGTDAFPAL
jgi:hypothetical protein